MLNMTGPQLFGIAKTDPFVAPYMFPFLSMSKGNAGIAAGYINQTKDLPITSLKDYEGVRDFFRETPQNVLSHIAVSLQYTI